MQIELVTWKILGIRPLIQSNPHVMWTAEAEDENELAEVSKPKRKRSAGVGVPKGDEAFAICRKQLYINEQGLCTHPVMAFWHELKHACRGRKFGKGPGATPALSVVTMGVTVMQEEFILYDPTTLDKPKPVAFTPDSLWQIDIRRAVNWNKNASRGGTGVVAMRPKWRQWGGLLTLEVDNDLFPKKDENGKTREHPYEALTEFLQIAGHNFGIGVGRMRMQALVKQQEQWTGFGAGQFSVELKQ